MCLISRVKHHQKLLLKEMAVLVAEHGFDRRLYGQSFRMPKPFGWASFHLAFIPHDEIDFDITADVALRVNAVEELVHADDKLISEKEKTETATIGCEIGNLSEGKQRRWKVVSERDVKPVAASIETALVSIALPYIERYSQLDEMFAILTRNDRDAWLHAPLHHYRGMHALALAVVLGKHDRLGSIIEQSETFMRSHNDPNLVFFHRFTEKICSLRKP